MIWVRACSQAVCIDNAVDEFYSIRARGVVKAPLGPNPAYSRSICSSVFPLVSGTRQSMNRNPMTQIPEYSQKVLAGPRAALSAGNVKVSTKHAIHNADTDTDTAKPRMRFGKISEMSTHVTGARDIA